MSYTITEICTGCGACVRVCPAHAISGEKKKPHTIASELCIQNSIGRACTAVKRSEWPKPRIDIKACMSCSICIDACPAGCLELSGATGKDPHGHPYLADEKKCIACGYCADECPVMAIIMTAPQQEPLQAPAPAAG